MVAQEGQITRTVGHLAATSIDCLRTLYYCSKKP
jgi:hypothetical protein